MQYMNWLKDVDFFKKLVVDSEYFSPMRPSRITNLIQWVFSCFAILLFGFLVFDFSRGSVEQTLVNDFILYCSVSS